MDLRAEFAAAQENVGVRHLKWLKSRGVGQVGLFGDNGFAFGILQIEVQPDDTWLPMPGGKEAMILYDEDRHECDDLLAFFPQAPQTVFRRTGHLMIAGDEGLRWAHEMREPVYVRADLVDWMAWGRTGIVILDWGDRRRLASELEGSTQLLVANEQLGRRLHAALSQPFDVPQILVPE